jgi:hypothetical protein
LSTVNGIGFALYGATDMDFRGSHIATYYFVFFAIPIIPICRYRVIPTPNGYRFLGKAPLRKFDWWHLFISLALFACLMIYLVASNGSSGGSYASPPAPRAPAYSPPIAPDTPASESKTVYRVPSYISAELDRESRVIDDEKATADRMARQLESLAREIEQKKLSLDRTSQSDLDEFNRKVDAYNGLLERVRAQNRLVNQLVESYNEKLRTNGR